MQMTREHIEYFRILAALDGLTEDAYSCIPLQSCGWAEPCGPDIKIYINQYLSHWAIRCSFHNGAKVFGQWKVYEP